jgi:hypothetical protein
VPPVAWSNPWTNENDQNTTLRLGIDHGNHW